jgi:hypothetical protein
MAEEYVPLHDLIVYVIPAIIASFAAIAAAVLSSKNKTRMEELKSQADTGNGRSIGETVHDTDQTVELLAAMMHTNTKEVIELSNKLDGHIQESTKVHERILRDIEGRKESRDV